LIFGIASTPYFWDDIKKFIEWCTRVEEMEFDSIFIADHYQFPVPPFYSNSLMDAWTTISYISAKTSRIKLGSLVSPIPRYIPSQLAKLIVNVDIFSNGRVIAGFGMGYSPEEFINYSPFYSIDEPKVLFEKFKEGLEVILKLWTMDTVTFRGKYYTLTDAVLSPKPLQKPHPPVWIGGVGTKILKLTAKYSNGWVPSALPTRIFTSRTVQSIENYENCMKIIQEHLKHYGRKTSEFTFSVLIRFESDPINLEKEAASIIEKYKEVGCQYIVIEFSPIYLKRYMELTEKFACDVMPSFT